MLKIENPQQTSENRMPPRSWYIPTGAGKMTTLNGVWRFAFFPLGDIRDDIAFEDTIDVPSCWQLKGYENPNYTNINYPFPCDPPFVPNINPVGVYEREFTINESDKNTYIVFEGVSSCAELYINGKYVGFTQGSHLMSEFDITDYVNEGENTVRVLVYKWCAGSYLEDQDQFRFNGIFRDVYILSRPKGHLFDIDLKTEDKKIVCNANGIYDITVLKGEETVAQISGAEGKCAIEIDNPVLWNAEKPFLYTVKIASAGEIITRKIGFRTIEISPDYELLINGTAVKLKGVNHHDTSPVNGWCMSDSDIIRDLELMKKLNINTIRTSHYPPSPRFLDYCDEMGFYVVLETDIETHGMLRRLADVPYCYDEDVIWPCNNPEWKKEHVERMARAYHRDKNHCSIIMWSLGNESNHGENSVAMTEWLRSVDKVRLIHHEQGSAKDAPESCDVYSRMYSPIKEICEWAKDDYMKQPVFLCEYAHSMGNGPGDIWDYVETFYDHKKLIGGCIWEWADHAVMVDGVQKYGGDFEGELTHDGNFCCDGMVFSDRSFKPGTYEVRSAYAPFRIKWQDGSLTISNRFDFSSFDTYRFSYEIICDEEIIEKRVISANILPKESFSITPAVTLPESCKYGCHIAVTMLDKNDNVLGVLEEEIPTEVKQSEITFEKATLREEDFEIIAEGENFRYVFSKLYGGFVSMVVNGEEKLLEPSKISYYRAATDNDRNIKARQLNINIWQGENYDCVFTKVYDVKVIDNKIIAECSASGISRAPFFRYVLELEFFANGAVKFNLNGNIRENTFFLPRLGFEFKLPYDNDKFRYFGNGPLESYCDMSHHGTVKFHESDADSEYVNYVYPQEHGNHIDVKVLKIENAFSFTADEKMEMSVLHHSIEDIYKATHTDELKKSDGTHIRIDYKVSGIGSNSCGPALAEKYQLKEKEISFGFLMEI
ncbi:MAG: glycoside hydrolase family 2 [Clostridia bacterium]|nr:glycoside hydrolase family 2 [Clostridia bacterium]